MKQTRGAGQHSGGGNGASRDHGEAGVKLTAERADKAEGSAQIIGQV